MRFDPSEPRARGAVHPLTQGRIDAIQVHGGRPGPSSATVVRDKQRPTFMSRSSTPQPVLAMARSPGACSAYVCRRARVARRCGVAQHLVHEEVPWSARRRMVSFAVCAGLYALDL